MERQILRRGHWGCTRPDSKQKGFVIVVMPTQVKNYSICPRVEARSTSRRFTCADVRTIYGFPSVPTTPVVVGVISVGGGLTGTIDPTTGVLTGGDVNDYWTSLGITSLPVVKVVRVNGSAFDLNDSNSTMENTLDIEMVGACCPTSNLTIIFYVCNQWSAPPGQDAFYNVFNYAINTPVNGVKPSIISCSWGAPESLFSASDLTRYNTLFAAASAQGITITCAAGDTGANNGMSTPTADFPCSSPNVVACGGTTLVCPNFVYDASTVETTWSWNGSTATGGGISKFFRGPPFPTPAGSLMRQVPDVSLVANPATGVKFTIQGNTNSILGGTSIVSPAIAGLMACLPPSPRSLITRLYALPTASFYDITVGNNGGYSAGPGFDLCTGRGSVNGSVFKTNYSALVANPVTGVTVTPSSVTLMAGATQQITGTASKSSGTVNLTSPNTVAWTSSNTAVATVTQAGLINAIGGGSAVITATTIDGFFSGNTAITVTVPVPPPPPVSSILISANFRARALNQANIRRNTQLQLYVFPSVTVTWSSSNPAIATVTNGRVIANRLRGRTTITARVPGGPVASVSIVVT